MGASPDIGQIVDTLVEASRLGTETALRMGGALMAPQVHLLIDDRDQPYVGRVSCRPFYRGGDVVDAMALMGAAASLAGASRLLVVWEHQDLCVALQQPGAEGEPSGQVVVEAVLDRGHSLWWHPFRIHPGPLSVVGGPTVIPEWGRLALHLGVELPTPVAVLLAVWRKPRTWTAAGRAATWAHLEEQGYRMRLVDLSGDERAPAVG